MTNTSSVPGTVKPRNIVKTAALAVLASIAGVLMLVLPMLAPGDAGLVFGQRADAITYSYRIPECTKGNGPGLKNWWGHSKQDGWSKWFYTKAGCNTAAVEHWGDVTK